MCGIAGYFHPQGKPIPLDVLQKMTRSFAYRGPDGEGYHIDHGIGLGHRRLSIIDLSGGSQPMFSSDRNLVVVFNGEIFNYLELREELIKKGHTFATHSDTEVLIYGYREWGRDVVQHLNGQFAVAIWDVAKKECFLFRDRLGIRPLFYADLPDGTFLFGSEMKALFAYPGFRVALDPMGLGQVFTFWANLAPRTVFDGVKELGAGQWMSVSPRGRSEGTYWKPTFPDAHDFEDKPLSYWTENLADIMYSATELQLRADVPVAAYLSGGIDSSVLSALVKRRFNPGLMTFSVAFKDRHFDESGYQNQMAEFLGTDHRIIEVGYDDIGSDFEDVVYLAEKPMIRTAPAPLLRLAGLVRKNGIKVVLTGEGSDEIFGGYSIFKEDKVRRFWARSPDSPWRPKLLGDLHPEAHRDRMASAFWQAFFKKGLTDTDNPFYSHLIRWRNTAQLRSLFAPEWRDKMGTEEQHLAELQSRLDPDFMRWHPLCRAQYLEMSLFLSGYLLSSQGDRMMMGQSVEGRVPFLDHRVVEFASTIPPKYKIRILNEKYVLKKTYESMLPPEIVNRPKQPYRAPISACFANGQTHLAAQLLKPEAIRSFGYFDPGQSDRLMAKASKSTDSRMSERDDMAMVTMASVQLLHHFFLAGHSSRKSMAP